MSNKNKIMTEKEYKNVKLLQQADVRSSKVAELTGRSWVTIDRIFKTEDFKGYQELVQSENKKWKAKRLAKAGQAQLKPVVSEEQPNPAELSAIKLLENLTTEVQGLRQDFNKLEDELEAVIAAKKVAFWRN